MIFKAQMQNQATILDPTLKEIEQAQNVLCIVYMTNSKKLPYMISKGKINNEQLEKVNRILNLLLIRIESVIEYWSL